MYLRFECGITLCLAGSFPVFLRLTEMKTISIIIPVKRGGVIAALEPLRCLKGELSEHIEVIVAEGAAPSRQRNLATGSATGEILYFLDDDSLIQEKTIALCLDAFQDDSVSAAGGPSLTPTEDGPLQQLFGSALGSVFGSGAMRFRYISAGIPRGASEKELILCNLAFRRAVFVDMGGFDERLYPNEENELLDRITSAGQMALHIPDMTVMRSQRSTLPAFVRQIFGYGRGRARQFLVSGRSSVVSFVPLIFLIYLICLNYLQSLHIIFLLPAALYILMNVFFTLQGMLRSRSGLSLWLFAIFPLLHLANGCGLLSGLLWGMPSRNTDDSIHIRCVKKFGREMC